MFSFYTICQTYHEGTRREKCGIMQTWAPLYKLYSGNQYEMMGSILISRAFMKIKGNNIKYLTQYMLKNKMFLFYFPLLLKTFHSALLKK